MFWIGYGKCPYRENGKGARADTIKHQETSEKNGHPCPKPITLWRKVLENDINNLMALCRDCHIKYGDKKQFKEYLNEVHKNKLETIKR